MLVAGVDVGAATAKTVILGDGKILGYAVRPVGYDVKLAANEVSKEALDRAGLSISMMISIMSSQPVMPGSLLNLPIKRLQKSSAMQRGLTL